tara:strand:+ start:60 stop:215 length:156 start_codon:yes stop_codon:yes gene_type:complete
MNKFIIGDKVRVIGQEYEKNMYDIIINITIDKFIIEDDCTYKANELEPFNM